MWIWTFEVAYCFSHVMDGKCMEKDRIRSCLVPLVLLNGLSHLWLSLLLYVVISDWSGCSNKQIRHNSYLKSIWECCSEKCAVLTLHYKHYAHTNSWENNVFLLQLLLLSTYRRPMSYFFQTIMFDTQAKSKCFQTEYNKKYIAWGRAAQV